MKPETLAVLNRLLRLHSRSLPVYLAECQPWTAPEAQTKAAAVREIAVSQKEMVDRLAELVLDLGGVTDLGDFPLNFTRYNDLSIDFLIGEMIAKQRREVQTIAACVDQLREAPEAALALAEEAHGAALGYLDKLVEVSQAAASAS